MLTPTSHSRKSAFTRARKVHLRRCLRMIDGSDYQSRATPRLVSKHARKSSIIPGSTRCSWRRVRRKMAVIEIKVRYLLIKHIGYHTYQQPARPELHHLLVRIYVIGVDRQEAADKLAVNNRQPTHCSQGIHRTPASMLCLAVYRQLVKAL